jgi:hypothetical protein
MRVDWLNRSHYEFIFRIHVPRRSQYLVECFVCVLCAVWQRFKNVKIIQRFQYEATHRIFYVFSVEIVLRAVELSSLDLFLASRRRESRRRDTQSPKQPNST